MRCSMHRIRRAERIFQRYPRTVDVVDRTTRSRMMSGIRGKNTKPELIVRKMLYAAGFRGFRIHRKDLPGAPDVVLPGRKVAVFVHGCFWHAHERCRYAAVVKSRRKFWIPKLAKNAKRDRHAIERLVLDGWRVLVVWECALRKPDLSPIRTSIVNWIAGNRRSGEIRLRPLRGF